MVARFLSIAVVLGISLVVPTTAAEKVKIYNLPAGLYMAQGDEIVGVELVGPSVPDVPTPPVNPDQMTDRSKAIKAAAEGATSDPYREQTAQQLASLFREIAKKVRSGEIKDPSVISFAVKYGVDQLLTGKGSTVTDAWKATRAIYNSQMKTAIQNGDNDAKIATLLDEVAIGIDASAPNAPAEFDIMMIIKIIEAIMEILKMIKLDAAVTSVGYTLGLYA